MEIKAVVGAKLGALTFNRSTSTNPFEKTNFKGRTFKGSVLPFADVFQAIKPVQQPKPNKLAMVAGAVVSAVVDFKTRLVQPIAMFAQRVRTNIARGVESMKNARNSIVEYGKNLHERVHNKVAKVFERHEKIGEPGPDGAIILNMKHINEKASLKDLKATWVAENSKIAEEGKAAA